MYFVLSKVLGFALMPSNIIALICVSGVVLIVARFRRSGLALMAVGILLLAVIGWSPVASWMLLPLSERFPVWEGRGDPDGIIVLGGAIDADLSNARGVLQTGAAAERLFAMLQLARRYPNVRIVYSGGSGALIGDATPEAPIAGKLLDQFGLGGTRVLLESKSRTTEENARYTRELVAPKPGERWLLVTSAWHMPRSVGVFRKAGFDVEAYPVDFRLLGWSDARRPFGQIAAGLDRADLAVHEWIGLLAAGLGGKSDDLFPAPR